MRFPVCNTSSEIERHGQIYLWKMDWKMEKGGSIFFILDSHYSTSADNKDGIRRVTMKLNCIICWCRRNIVSVNIGEGGKFLFWSTVFSDIPQISWWMQCIRAVFQTPSWVPSGPWCPDCSTRRLAALQKKAREIAEVFVARRTAPERPEPKRVLHPFTSFQGGRAHLFGVCFHRTSYWLPFSLAENSRQVEFPPTLRRPHESRHFLAPKKSATHPNVLPSYFSSRFCGDLALDLITVSLVSVSCIFLVPRLIGWPSFNVRTLFAPSQSKPKVFQSENLY